MSAENESSRLDVEIKMRTTKNEMKTKLKFSLPTFISDSNQATTSDYVFCARRRVKKRARNLIKSELRQLM